MRKEVVRFVVQYEALIRSRWHPVVRYDTAHHEAHAHLFHPDGTSDRTVLEFPTYAEAFTHAYRDLKARWRWYRMGHEQEFDHLFPEGYRGPMPPAAPRLWPGNKNPGLTPLDDPEGVPNSMGEV